MKLIILSLLVACAMAVPQNQNKYYPSQTYQGQPYQGQQYQGQAYQGQYYPGQYYQNKNFVPIVSETNELNPDGSYRYSYVTGDGQQQQVEGYLKNAGNPQTEAEVAQGSYSYTAPDGTPITVNWVADEFGYRASGAHIPTPPPIPEAIQKSLNIQRQYSGYPGYNDPYNQGAYADGKQY